MFQSLRNLVDTRKMPMASVFIVNFEHAIAGLGRNIPVLNLLAYPVI